MRYGPDAPDTTYVSHSFDEHVHDTGEVLMNYARAGRPDRPALLLIPAQAESWWGYEQAMTLLADDFEVFAVDLRGQGRSTRTPCRYTVDNFGNDLVRFIAGRVRRPVIVSGLSSGGVVSAWLSSYAPPGMIRAACYEDPPLFASELTPACGPSIRQAIGPVFALLNKYLGDQWSVGDWGGFQRAARTELPASLVGVLGAPLDAEPATNGDEPPQNLKEYDPEWARAFWSGTAMASCDHARMLSAVRVPVLLTHHFRQIDEATGVLTGALSDRQARRVGELVAAAGQRLDYRSLPDMGHHLHNIAPAEYATILREWIASLPSRAEASPGNSWCSGG